MTGRAMLSVGVLVAVLGLVWPAEPVLGRWPAPAVARPARPHPARPRPARSRPARRRSLRAAPAAVVAIAVTALWWSVPLGALVVTAIPAQRWVACRRAVGRRRRALDEVVPEAIDLCTVVLGAGGTIRDCVDALADHGPPAVRPIVADVTRRADGTERIGGRLRRLQAELGPAFQPLTGALLLAAEQGGSVGSLLARLSVESSAGRRRRGELRARRLPVALLLPLVTCSLPAVIVGAVIPLLVVAVTAIDL